jgi:uncharacterized protein (TIGR02597 family)
VTTVTTDPVGFTTTSLPAASDTFLSIPFTRPPEFIGAISSASGSTITVSGSPWTASQFVYGSNGGAQHNHYYVLIGPCNPSPPKEGHTFAVTGNTTNSLTVDTTLENVTGIPANTQITIIPNWTPATVFPATDATFSFTPTASPGTYKTLIRVPNSSGPGYAAEYYFFNSAWQRVTAGNGNDDALLPDSYFVVRNDNGAPTLPLTSLGAVLLKKLSVPLMVQTSQAQDNAVSLLRPLDVALNASGLGPAFVTGDQLLLFNNAQIAFDKSPSAIYSHTNLGGWLLSGDASMTDRGSDVIPTGTGFIVRKAASNNGTVFWTDSFPVTAIGAVSRKSHGGVPGSPFDIPLPLIGTPGVECRTVGQTPAGAGVDYQIVFTFPTAVSFSGASSSPQNVVVSSSGNNTTNPTVNLTGVINAQRITVTLLNVNDGTNTNDVGVRVGFLIGDTTADGSVNSADIGQTKSQSGHAVTTSNFREDVTADGSINSADIGLVKSKSGTALP